MAYYLCNAADTNIHAEQTAQRSEPTKINAASVSLIGGLFQYSLLRNITEWLTDNRIAISDCGLQPQIMWFDHVHPTPHPLSALVLVCEL